MFRAALSGAPARRFFAAHAQSCLGTGLAYVALPLLAYDRFGSPWAIAAVLLPDLLPAIVLGPLLGALVDRIGWRLCAVVADVLRCIAFVVVMTADSLPVMIAGAAFAGLGTALFHPSALAGLPRLMGDRDDARAAGMGLFSAIDDVGLTAGPALAALLLAVLSPTALMGVNAVTFAISATLLATVVTRGLPAHAAAGAAAARGRSLFADARAGVRELASRPEIRTLLGSSTGIVLCVGITNIGEIVLAREVLGVSDTGLAVMVTAGGLGTVLGSLCARFTTAGAWAWRQAYVIGALCMAVELVACGVLHTFWLVVPALALGGFGNGLALVHDRLLLAASTPESLHGRLFALQKTCTSFAFAISFLASGALIAGAGVETAFLVSALGLALVLAAALPRLRAAWPAPPTGRPPSLGDALA
jgi:MFS family permease